MMPMEFQYDPNKKALFGMIEDPLTIEEYRSSIESIVGSEEFPPDIRTLWDMRNFEFKGVDREFEEALIGVSAEYPERTAVRVALVVINGLGLGRAAMFEILAKNLGYESMVFTDYPGAEMWLLDK
jgi:hypothetical protein